MPPKCRFTREEVIDAALELTREGGIDAVTARAVGARLHSSSKVIFSLFENMEELLGEVVKAADSVYREYLKEDMTNGKYPAYKASGIAYIRLAKEEKELFRLLFMRDRSGEVITKNTEEVEPFLKLIRQNTGLGEQEAYWFHFEMWVYVHGIASMIATSYLDLDWEDISRMLTDVYEGLRGKYEKKISG